MAVTSQPYFLQALGWATLNSLWQLGLLWCVFMATRSVFRLSSSQRYLLAAATLFAGFGWFLITFFQYFINSKASFGILSGALPPSGKSLQIMLTAASYAYLLLLAFPIYRFYKSWKYIQYIKKEGLHKADIGLRLFVQKSAANLGITRKVMLYLSDLITSPVTIGYLKPIILVPVAALNHLSLSQTEAILLHELSHIKRYDYLLNLMASLIKMVLYYNPFVTSLLRILEAERENCCDELVLNYEYDKMSYASALLTLEKMHTQVLAIPAAGKKHLISRIERIIGMKHKREFKFNQVAGVFAAILCVIVFNSLLLIKEEHKQFVSNNLAFTSFANPFYFEGAANLGTPTIIKNATPLKKGNFASTAAIGPVTEPINKGKDETILNTVSNIDVALDDQPVMSTTPSPAGFQNVGFDEVDGSLSKAEKEHVKTTVTATEKILTSTWQEVSDSIADAMDSKEKELAHFEYLNKIQQINWLNLEKNLKAQYNSLNWQKIDQSIAGALTKIQLDSVQKVYSQVLEQLKQAKSQALCQPKVSVSPVPDVSIEDIQKAQIQLQTYLKLMNAARNRKVVHL